MAETPEFTPPEPVFDQPDERPVVTAHFLALLVTRGVDPNTMSMDELHQAYVDAQDDVVHGPNAA